ncbi:hypothetical protein [Rhodopirellula halodulae]|nr:hypothetical protein [Rhodopirellula sp. JC737]
MPPFAGVEKQGPSFINVASWAGALLLLDAESLDEAYPATMWR